MARGRSAREWGLDLDRFMDRADDQMEMIAHKIALDMDQAVVLATPVDNGTARGNWYPSINVPSTAVDATIEDPSGSQSLGRLTASLGGFTIGSTLWFTNNLPYILPLENGHSKQAPQGMVDVNLDRFAAQYGGAIER